MASFKANLEYISKILGSWVAWLRIKQGRKTLSSSCLNLYTHTHAVYWRVSNKRNIKLRNLLFPQLSFPHVTENVLDPSHGVVHKLKEKGREYWLDPIVKKKNKINNTFSWTNSVIDSSFLTDRLTLRNCASGLMVIPCKKTVKKTTARVAVTNSGWFLTFFGSMRSTRANATAPLKPPYDMMNFSTQSSFCSRKRFAASAKIITPYNNEC